MACVELLLAAESRSCCKTASASAESAQWQTLEPSAELLLAVLLCRALALHLKLMLCLRMTEAVPKRILDAMNVEGLTRENVASHLQVQLHLAMLHTQAATAATLLVSTTS